MRKLLENYLEVQPKARERSNKYRTIANMLITMYQLDIPKETLTKIVDDSISLDRLFRKVLEDRPDLRGNDYSEKDKLEEQALIKLGYK